MYWEHCKLSCVRYIPWDTDYSCAYGGCKATEEEIIARWELFVEKKRDDLISKDDCEEIRHRTLFYNSETIKMLVIRMMYVN